MAIFRLPTPLRKYTEGKEEITVAGATVREAIANLESSHQGIGERILDDKAPYAAT
jgi:molybdopterin synthase sulfur carrier subunit